MAHLRKEDIYLWRTSIETMLFKTKLDAAKAARFSQHALWIWLTLKDVMQRRKEEWDARGLHHGLKEEGNSDPEALDKDAYDRKVAEFEIWWHEERNELVEFNYDPIPTSVLDGVPVSVVDLAAMQALGVFEDGH